MILGKAHIILQQKITTQNGRASLLETTVRTNYTSVQGTGFVSNLIKKSFRSNYIEYLKATSTENKVLRR